MKVANHAETIRVGTLPRRSKNGRHKGQENDCGRERNYQKTLHYGFPNMRVESDHRTCLDPADGGAAAAMLRPERDQHLARLLRRNSIARSLCDHIAPMDSGLGYIMARSNEACPSVFTDYDPSESGFQNGCVFAETRTGRTSRPSVAM